MRAFAAAAIVAVATADHLKYTYYFSPTCSGAVLGVGGAGTGFSCTPIYDNGVLTGAVKLSCINATAALRSMYTDAACSNFAASDEVSVGSLGCGALPLDAVTGMRQYYGRMTCEAGTWSAPAVAGTTGTGSIGITAYSNATLGCAAGNEMVTGRFYGGCFSGSGNEAIMPACHNSTHAALGLYNNTACGGAPVNSSYFPLSCGSDGGDGLVQYSCATVTSGTAALGMSVAALLVVLLAAVGLMY